MTPSKTGLGLLAAAALAAAVFACATAPSAPPAAAGPSADEIRARKEAAFGRGGEGAPSTQAPAPAGPAVQTGPAPDWVALTPSPDGNYLYGVGRASLDEGEYQRLAQERALADIAGRIAVTVRRETSDYTGFAQKGKKTTSEQEVEETVKTTAQARLRSPEAVARYRNEEEFFVLVRVPSRTPIQEGISRWSQGIGVTRFREGSFLDDRGVRTGFGDYLRDLVVSSCCADGGTAENDPSLPAVEGRYLLLSDSISVTLRVVRPDGSVTHQSTFAIPAEPEHLVMMATRRDRPLVNAVPQAVWGKGKLSLSGEVLSEGQEVVITFTPEQDCYVAVFNIGEDGTVTRLFPNRYRRDNRVEAGTPLVLPGQAEREKGIVFRVSLPAGRSVARESVKVVATQKPVDLAGAGFSEAVMESYRPDSEGIGRLLALLQGLDDGRIPWFEEVRSFVIRAR